MATWSDSRLPDFLKSVEGFLRNIAEKEGDKDALTDELSYYNADVLRRDFVTPNDLWVRLCDSIRNRQFMHTVINDDYFARIKPKLLHINLHDIATAPDPVAWARLTQIINTTCSVPPGTQDRKGSCWKIFKQGAVEGSRYLTKFRDAGKFYAYVDSHSTTAEDAWELAGELDEIEGIGRALACDFLKEIGVDRYGKPDTHVKNLLRQLGLICGKDEDRQAFIMLRRLSNLTTNPQRTTVEVDKVLWIAKSGRWDRTLDKRVGSQGLKKRIRERQMRFDNLIAQKFGGAEKR